MTFGNHTICSPDRDRNSAIELTCLRTIANTDDVQRLWPLSISRFSIVLQCVTTHLPECLIASKVPSGAGIDNETGTAVWQLGSQNWGDPKDPGIDPKVTPKVIKFGPQNASLRIPPETRKAFEFLMLEAKRPPEGGSFQPQNGTRN